MIDDLDDQVFRALTDVQTKLGQSSFEELVTAFEEVERRFVPLFEARGETWKALETRRRVAEDILGVAIDHNHSPAECEALVAKIADLGFDDIRSKGDVILMFSGYCVRRGSSQRARQHLIPLRSELEAELTRTGDAVIANYLRACQELLERIDRADGRDNG